MSPVVSDSLTLPPADLTVWMIHAQNLQPLKTGMRTLENVFRMKHPLKAHFLSLRMSVRSPLMINDPHCCCPKKQSVGCLKQTDFRFEMSADTLPE